MFSTISAGSSVFRCDLSLAHCRMPKSERLGSWMDESDAAWSIPSLDDAGSKKR